MPDDSEESRIKFSITTAADLSELLWPEFIQENGCIFAAFHGGGGTGRADENKTELECFINHTHILDQFLHSAGFSNVERISEELSELEVIYDETHSDFIQACELGRKMARMWACKLKTDFPDGRFRVYYTKYDNPIVRFHKVRLTEHIWLTDQQLLEAADPSFQGAMIYDTEYLTLPIVKD